MDDGLTTTAEHKPDLPALKRMYEESQSLTRDGRLLSQRDDDYYHGYQWTKTQKRVLSSRSQPPTVWNFLRLAVNGTLGVIKQGASDPRAYAREPGDESGADVASKSLRYMAETSNFAAAKIDAAKNYLVPGTCAAIVEVDEERNVIPTLIRWEDHFYDARSRLEDFSDARYQGIGKWRFVDDVVAEHPDKKDQIETSLGDVGLSFDDTTQDRPSEGGTKVAWVDKAKRRIMVIEIYYREGGTWYWCKFCSGLVLAASESPYLDKKKRPCCPIIAQSCYVDRENNRYGIARDMVGPQNEINARSSKLLHELSVRQLQETIPGAAAGVDAAEAKAEAAKPDGLIPSGLAIVQRQDVVAGQAALLQGATQALERFAPNPAILGRQGENQSGRANQIRQQAGMTEQAIVFGGIEEWEVRVYRQMWCTARQFWTAPMYIRVAEDESAPTFLGINQPPTMPGPPQMGPDGQPVPGEPIPGQPAPDPENPGQQLVEQGQPVFQMPNGEKVLGYENAIGELDVDIMIDRTADTANLQQEQFQMLVDLVPIYGPQEVPFDDVLEASTMPNKRKIIEKRKARQEEAAKSQQTDPMKDQQVRMGEAQINKTEAEAVLNAAKAQNEMDKPQQQALDRLAEAQRPQQSPPPGL